MEKHISDLLYVHDCVIVPGLGGFVANHKPAVVVEERNLFRPPSKEIGFNRSLSHNDGLLAKHVSQREQISWEESLERIRTFV
ncbi:MAG: SPOR domain-containing protein, partial [Bacteroidota bacterium]